MSEEDFQYGDYDLEADVTPVPASEALDYPEVTEQDDLTKPEIFGFTNKFGRTPKEAIAIARQWYLTRKWAGVGRCLATVRLYYAVPAKYLTATLSWQAADHKHPVASGTDVPRGAPVWWTGGSSGAGHVAISVGGGLCLSTDWKERGRVDYARIDEITSRWGLDFKGYTNEVNDVFVWKPAPVKATVKLSNLKPGKRNDDVKELKKVLWGKGYRGFLRSSGFYGRGIKKAYAKYQHRLGFDGKAADGVPGELSLKKLGFRVVN